MTPPQPRGPNQPAPAPAPQGGPNRRRRRRRPNRPNQPNNPPNHNNGGGNGGNGGNGGGGGANQVRKFVASRDHPGYFGAVVSPQFSAYGQDNPFGQFLSNTALARAEQLYTNALYQKPHLRFDRFLGQLGAGRQPGYLAPLGTGQAVDTGNPFTSSSGGGGPQVPLAPTAPNGRGPVMPTLGQAGKKKRLGKIGTTYTDQLRRDFLSLSPLERGESALGKTAVPGRWSPWG